MSGMSFINLTSMVGLLLLNLWLLKVMLRCVKDGVTTIKSGHQTTGNARDMVRWVILHTVPFIEKVYVWRTPKEAYNLECLVPTVK
jgi:hypothetical protein